MQTEAERAVPLVRDACLCNTASRWSDREKHSSLLLSKWTLIHWSSDDLIVMLVVIEEQQFYSAVCYCAATADGYSWGLPSDMEQFSQPKVSFKYWSMKFYFSSDFDVIYQVWQTNRGTPAALRLDMRTLARESLCLRPWQIKYSQFTTWM